MEQYTIQIKKGVARMPEVRLAEPVDLELHPKEHVAIIGPNASGKSLLVDMLTGKIALQSTGSIAFDCMYPIHEVVHQESTILDLSQRLEQVKPIVVPH